ncbi:hypothetical protein cypCar_00043694 [Cyprinus carpio]|nr:hypothetical protein cypCar_00043694 [Cyprinus carpio]
MEFPCRRMGNSMAEQTFHGMESICPWRTQPQSSLD